jgi:predicted nuclease of predicted toxin-antitoxin system
MKLLVDNNLSFKLVQPLQNHYPETQHVRDALSLSTDDISIWNYAKSNGFIILTKDNDFDERSQLEGCPPKIIHLICGNKTTLHILNLLLWRQEEILSFGNSDSENCILKIS